MDHELEDFIDGWEKKTTDVSMTGTSNKKICVHSFIKNLLLS